jgi:hypothetical protein
MSAADCTCGKCGGKLMRSAVVFLSLSSNGMSNTDLQQEQQQQCVQVDHCWACSCRNIWCCANCILIVWMQSGDKAEGNVLLLLL